MIKELSSPTVLTLRANLWREREHIGSIALVILASYE
jgi:hypothetical protein